MTIYDYVFGISCGQAQVNCCFHDDATASAGIGPDMQYNCFACGAKAHDDVGFIMKYFHVSTRKAQSIKTRLENMNKYIPTKNTPSIDQRNYLHSIGLTDKVIDKYFYSQSNGKLMYGHTWNGLTIGSTWFNNPALSNYNASAEKYKLQGVIGGLCTPYDDVMKYDTLIICEGEKDMLTAKSLGIANAVAKTAGARTPILGGINFDNKNIVIIYDCDESGRSGAEADASYLMTEHNCKVKVIDLGLQDKEDLNDYFIKYKHTVQDLGNLVQSTSLFVVPPHYKESKVERFLKTLTLDELKELRNKVLSTPIDEQN